MRISDWSSDVCSSDLIDLLVHLVGPLGHVDVADLGRREVVDRINAEALGRHQDGGHGADLVAVEDLRNLAGRIAMDDDAALGDDRGVLEFGAGAGVDRGLEQRLETRGLRPEEHTSELQSLMRISYAD